MQTLTVSKSPPLLGEVHIHGAKNSALPILAACTLCRGACTIRGCPDILDVRCAMEILRSLGCPCRLEGGTASVGPFGCGECRVPGALAESMRASVLFLGALLARTGEASVTLPGGCPIGARPIDLHLGILRRLGAEILLDGKRIVCRAGRLTGCRIALPFPRVGATEHAMLAAVGAQGCTQILGAAREPEIVDLACFLNSCGARVEGAGTGCIEITGMRPLSGAEHTLLPDRIEAATYLCACACCGGRLTLLGAEGGTLLPVAEALSACGCTITQRPGAITAAAPHPLTGGVRVTTAPYPGFPTDAQPLLMAALARARGESRITETIFERRFLHVPELRRLGAQIALRGPTAAITGVKELTGAQLTARDLRGGAALILAAMSAEGESTVAGMNHLERGYDNLIPTLCALGARIRASEQPRSCPETQSASSKKENDACEQNENNRPAPDTAP